MRTLRKIREFISYIPEGVKNLIAYAPIIWRDQDWDHSFFLELLQFKLLRMERWFEGHLDFKERSGEIFLQISQCRHALDRYLEDDYCVEEFAAHTQKWGKDTCPVCGEWGCGCFRDERGYHLVSIHENVKSLEDDIQASKEYVSILRTCREHRERDLEFVFDRIGRYVEGWWD